VGLGLAIVDAIMKAHGGQCEVVTGEGGSTFGLRFPSSRSSRAAPALEVAPLLLPHA
jgi:signal transduction histidine kinase